ncbi:MAG: hypothetical protein A2Z95_05620 [Gallionellales bacterium GWA2_60_18]|nr:MAG: hypothetical protein A2Z95_05620 [Gallionellales bacterium GWA2_60_18]
MKKLFNALLLPLVCLPGLAVAAPDLFEAVNKAGYQRMLSQRIVKTYCQAGLGISAAASRAQLSAAVNLFEKRLGELKPSAAASPLAKDDLAQLQAQWKHFKKTATGPVKHENAMRLLEQGEQVLHIADRLTAHLQDAAADSYSRLINVAGRQRMLSQRLAKYYMLRAWSIRSARIDEELDAAANEFDAALKQLAAAPENTPEIASELEAVEIQWLWFQAALAMEGAQSYRVVVADASDAILNRMDHITRLYETGAKE